MSPEFPEIAFPQLNPLVMALSDNSQRLIKTIQKLSVAPSLEKIMALLNSEARALVGADGASFVIREGGFCFYADEDAIGPLWKGKRFPIETCVSGWAMAHKQVVVIEDIFTDPRVPVDLYEPTFARSLVMTPIGIENPLGALGIYWAKPYRATEEQLELLMALANSTSVALNNLTLIQELEREKLKLENTNRELQRIAWATSHHLQEPLRHLSMYFQLLDRQCKTKLNSQESSYIDQGIKEVAKLQNLSQSVLAFSRLEEKPLKLASLSSESLLLEVKEDLRLIISETNTEIETAPLPEITADKVLLKKVFTVLLLNAIQFKSSEKNPRVSVTSKSEGPEIIFCIEDKGVGIGSEYHEKIFQLFSKTQPGVQEAESGMGLAFAKKIIELHHGRLWVESAPSQGSRFFFSLPRYNF